jgi:glycogen synthase
MKDSITERRILNLTLKSKRVTLTAIQERIDQQEGFDHAREAIETVVERGGSDYEAIVAGGDAYFAFIKETCGVERQ